MLSLRTETQTKLALNPRETLGSREHLKDSQVFRILPEAIVQFGCQVSHLPGECCNCSEERVTQNDIQHLKNIDESLKNSCENFYQFSFSARTH